MISVILPVYNSDRYLSETLDSIINQSFKEIEIICIDDGSTDNSLSILNKYKSKDCRIKLISRGNKGLIYTLNEGIKLSKYKYIARMDSDDIAHLDRLQIQFDFLEKNNKYAVVGSRTSIIDQEGKFVRFSKNPCSNFIIKALLPYGSVICHPSVMFNKQRLGNDLWYDKEYILCEDYELWCRLSKNDYLFYNLNNKLLCYRIHSNSVSRINDVMQKQAMLNVKKKYFFPTLNLMELNKIFNNKSNFFCNVFYILRISQKFKYNFITLIYYCFKRWSK